MRAKLIQWNEIPDGGAPDLTARIERARAVGRYFEFGGGLGDIITKSSKSAVFAELHRGGEPIVVLLVTQNPNSWEIFAFHPNARDLTIVNIPYKVVQSGPGMHSPEFRRRFGLPASAVESVVIYGEDFRFHPSKTDLLVIESLPGPYVAFAVTAADGSADKRTIPTPLVADAVRLVFSEGLTVVFVGRDYNINGSTVPHFEVPPPEDPRCRSVINALTVPGSAEVLRRAVVSVVCDSAMGCAAHAMSVPTFGLVHDEMWRACGGPEAGHGEIMDPRNYQCRFGAFQPEILLRFIRSYGLRGLR